jgi:hypothetical protein
MENVHFNLSEEEFSKGKKIMLWIFASCFFFAGIATLLMSLLYDSSIEPAVSAAPFGISLVTGIIAGMATFKRSDHYFSIDDDKIDFKYGMGNVKVTTIRWVDIKDIYFPHKQKKIKVVMKDNTQTIINLTWVQKKKSSLIRKHLFTAAREKNINLIKVQLLD